MQHLMLKRREALAALAVTSLAGPARADAAAFKPAAGPFRFRVVNDLDLAAPHRAIPVRVTVPETPGPHPVIVFSHGALSSKDLYFRVIEHWASHGYAAIQPSHVDSESLGYRFGAVAPADIMSTRIADMTHILDHLDDIAIQAVAAGALDSTRVAVGGHSFGGWIALIMAGLPLLGPEATARAYGHPRVKALVSYNGTGPMPQVANDRWGDVRVPLFAASGTNDPGATGDGVLRPWRWRISAYDLAGSREKYAVSITLGDHYYGGLICRDGAGGAADPQGLAAVNGASTAFLDAVLRGDKAARTFLRTADLRPLTANRAFLERRVS